MSDLTLLALCAGVLAAVWLLLRRITRRRAPDRRPFAVIDGSNVMHWKDNAPDLAPLTAVVDLLRAKGYRTGVIFDASAGHRLVNRYQDDAALAMVLGLPPEDVFVVPRGTQADPFLLDFARDTGAVLVSNDRFRDRIAEYPELAAPGRLVRGGWRDGRVWLDLPRN